MHATLAWDYETKTHTQAETAALSFERYLWAFLPPLLTNRDKPKGQIKREKQLVSAKNSLRLRGRALQRRE
jgi:hypothetical protein